MSHAQSAYRDVAAQLRAAINSGDYPRGGKLPTEDDLAAELGVNRSVINDALRILRAEGLVRVHRGKGMFVTQIPVIRRNAVTRQQRATRETGRGAFDAELRALGLTGRSVVQIERSDAPPTEVTDVLGAAEVVVRRREMFADDIPVQAAVSYIPADIAGGTQIEQEDTGTGGLYSRLADLGHAPARFGEDIIVRPPEADEIQFLRMEPDQRVYVITRTAFDDAGRAVEVCVHVMPVHQWELHYEWSAS